MSSADRAVRRTNPRLRFGIDIDGVMYMWDKTARYMLRTERGYSRDVLGEPSRYWNEIKDKVSAADWDWLWTSGVKMGLFRYGHLFTGTIEAIRTLNTIGDVVVMTHRPRTAVQDTFDWLSYMRLPILEAYVFSNGEPKSQVKCDLYVDDKPENAIDFNDNTDGLPLLWSRESNVNYGFLETKRESRIVRVDKWEEVVEFARKLR